MLAKRVGLAIDKKQKYYSLQNHQLPENLILIVGFYGRAKN